MQKNRRTIILINKKFQLKFCLYVCSWVAALSFFYPLIVNNLFTQLVDCMGAHQVATGIVKATAQEGAKLRSQLLILVALLQVFFLIVMFIISLFMSHRIAGPIYKLRKFMELARSGDFRSGLAFREKDHFSEVAEEYNLVMDSVRGALQIHYRDLGEAIEGLEKSGASSESVQKLRDIAARLKLQSGDLTPSSSS